MIVFLSITGVLRTVLIILVIYYVLKVFMRIFGPYLFNYTIKKAQGRYQKQNPKQHQDRSGSKVGETVIDRMPNQKTSNKDVGEYVDYEEVD